jgi:hypothetical protein
MSPYISIINKQKCLFLKNEGQEDKTGLVWGLVPVEGHKKKGKESKYGKSAMHSCMKMEL